MRKRKAQYLLCLILRGWAAASPWSAACCNEVLLISGPSLFRVNPSVLRSYMWVSIASNPAAVSAQSTARYANFATWHRRLRAGCRFRSTCKTIRRSATDSESTQAAKRAAARASKVLRASSVQNPRAQARHQQSPTHAGTEGPQPKRRQLPWNANDDM